MKETKQTALKERDAKEKKLSKIGLYLQNWKQEWDIDLNNKKIMRLVLK